MQIVLERVDLHDDGSADEVRRARRHDPRHLAHERAPGVGVADEELDLRLAETAREHADGLDLGIRDAHHLTRCAAYGDRAQRQVLDDAFDLPRLDRHRVADSEPALVEHQEPCDHVGEEALRGEGDEDHDERGAGDRLHSVGPEHDRQREQAGEHPGDGSHGRPGQGDRRLPLPQGRDHARVLDARRVLPLAAEDEEGRDTARRPAHEPSADEDDPDRDRLPEWRKQRRRVVQLVNERRHVRRPG
jgi:hypothetical protein